MNSTNGIVTEAVSFAAFNSASFHVQLLLATERHGKGRLTGSRRGERANYKDDYFKRSARDGSPYYNNNVGNFVEKRNVCIIKPLNRG